MSEKMRIRYPIVVEGRYDRQRIAEAVDAVCISTDGFGVFNSREIAATLKALAKKTPLIILTDSDAAGSVIRRRISQYVSPKRMINLYTPQIEGKEKRKRTPSKQGLLGVEGIDVSIIRDLLSPFACDREEIPRTVISKADLYEAGLTGKPNSSDRRDALAAVFGLPKGMTPNALIAALSCICSREEYEAALEKADNEINPTV